MGERQQKAGVGPKGGRREKAKRKQDKKQGKCGDVL